MNGITPKRRREPGRRRTAVPILCVGILLGWFAAGLTAPPSAGSAALEGPRTDESVLDAVQMLFDAMEARDGTAAATIMDARGQFFRVPLPFQGLPDPTPLASFAESLDRPGPHLLERMIHPQVLVHERIAVAWTPYDFHTDGEFSHCGVNAFTMVRREEGWIITGITYTVEPDPESCPEGLGPGTAPGPHSAGDFP